MGRKIKSKTWDRYYSRWKTDCRNDLRTKGHTVTRNNPIIFEDGSIVWRSEFYCSSAMFVTAWRDSKHYRDVKDIDFSTPGVQICK